MYIPSAYLMSTSLKIPFLKIKIFFLKLKWAKKKKKKSLLGLPFSKKLKTFVVFSNHVRFSTLIFFRCSCRAHFCKSDFLEPRLKNEDWIHLIRKRRKILVFSLSFLYRVTKNEVIFLNLGNWNTARRVELTRLPLSKMTDI